MRFTPAELKSIEQTMFKLEAVAHTMWDRSSTDGANARAIAFIISEMRLCADLVASDDRATRVSGYDRLDDLLKAKA
jgi:hypothetical protein